jgi:hypothetical protein
MLFRRIILASFVMWSAVLALPESVSAGPIIPTMRLRVEDLMTGTGMGVVLTDNSVGDIRPEAGVITWSGTLSSGGGGLTIDITTGASKPVVGDANSAYLDLNSVSITMNGPSKLRLTLEDSGWGIPGETFSLRGLIGGTLVGPGTLTAQSWANPFNAVPNLGADTGNNPVPLPAIGGVPAGSVGAFSSVFTTGAGAFSSEGFSNFSSNGPFSLFTQVSIDFAGPGFVSFDHAVGAVAVPEPGTLMMFGTGLLALANRARRRYLAPSQS